MMSKSKKNVSNYYNMNDQELSLFINSNVERYLKFKKSCDIAKKILKDNCHDFYISLSTYQEDLDYVHFLDIANLRNINILYNYDNVECTAKDLVPVLNAMCILELSWLDEHRYIYTENSEAYYEEEDKIIGFYKFLISSLSDEQVSLATESFEECVLSLC